MGDETAQPQTPTGDAPGHPPAPSHPPAPGHPPVAGERGGSSVTLAKGFHRWSFSCDAGDESRLLGCLPELARREEVPFDWFDAALVSHQLSRRLRPGLLRVDVRGEQEQA